MTLFPYTTLFRSSPRSSEAADVVDPLGIPAAQRCGGGGGEIPAGLREAGEGRTGGGRRQQERGRDGQPFFSPLSDAPPLFL